MMRINQLSGTMKRFFLFVLVQQLDLIDEHFFPTIISSPEPDNFQIFVYESAKMFCGVMLKLDR
jgi:hypothetical protein